MAKSMDSYNDLHELGIDSTDDEVSTKFSKAANHLQTLLPNVDNSTLVLLYGYYKQAIDGPCKAPKPSWFDLKAKYKWEAWNKLGNMPQNQAKELYIDNIKKLDPTFVLTSANKEGWVTVSTLQQQEKRLNDSEKSVVDYIRENRSVEVSQILQEFTKQELQEMLTKLDSDGLGLIHWAADSGSLDVLKILINSGADVNLPDSEKQTPLHYASSCGHVNCVSLLLEKGAEINAKDNDGETPLSVCTDSTIKELLSQFK